MMIREVEVDRVDDELEDSGVVVVVVGGVV